MVLLLLGVIALATPNEPPPFLSGYGTCREFNAAPREAQIDALRSPPLIVEDRIAAGEFRDVCERFPDVPMKAAADKVCDHLICTKD